MRRTLAWFSCLAALSACPHAGADPETNSAPLAAFREGNRLLRAHRYAEAAELYRASYASSGNQKALFNLGIALVELERNAEATDVLITYLGDPAANPRKRRVAEALLERARARTAQVVIVTNEPNVTISIDSRGVGSTPLSRPIRVDLGVHTIAAKKADRAAFETVELGSADKELTVRLSLLPPAEQTRGALRLARTSATPKPKAAESSTGSGQRAFGIAAASLGVIATGIGVGFGLDAKSKWSRAEHACPNNRCTSSDDLHLDDDARASARISTVAFALGGAALAGGALLYFTAPRSREGMNLGAGVTATPQTVGLNVGGRFQ